MGSITASCGHEVAEVDDMVDVSYQEQTREGAPAIAYASFCQTCAAEWRAKGLLFADFAAAEAWLKSQRVKP